jgi:hypothetical protein
MGRVGGREHVLDRQQRVRVADHPLDADAALGEVRDGAVEARAAAMARSTSETQCRRRVFGAGAPISTSPDALPARAATSSASAGRGQVRLATTRMRRSVI